MLLYQVKFFFMEIAFQSTHVANQNKTILYILANALVWCLKKLIHHILEITPLIVPEKSDFFISTIIIQSIDMFAQIISLVLLSHLKFFEQTFIDPSLCQHCVVFKTKTLSTTWKTHALVARYKIKIIFLELETFLLNLKNG